MADIFLSYNRDDQATARRFAEGFEREGFSVWWDQTLHSGENYDQVTEGALREAKAVVVLWSKKSVDSRWVRAEATTADRAGTLVPAMIEPCNRPIMFELKHTAELAHWKGEAHDPAWKAFVADVRRFVGKGEASGSTPVDAHGPRSFRVSAKAVWLLVAAALLVGGAVWAVMYWGDWQASTTASTAAPITPLVAAPVTLAVLPFANLSSDPEQEYFSDGLTEEILNQLAQIKTLRVTGRTSSFSFKGKNEDLRVIGQKLGVANLLEGSVRKDGTNLRITAQLISGKDGAHLWSKTYARDLLDVFAVQEEVAQDVAHALSVTLDVGDMRRSEGGTTNLEAYDKFLLARKLADGGGKSEFDRAIHLYREAVALDPSFARAWLELQSVLVDYQAYVPESRAALVAESDAVSRRVVALAPNAWWTQALRARQAMNISGARRNWAEATTAAAEALAAAPASAFEAISTNVVVLASAGRLRESVDYLERSREANPLSFGVSNSLLYMFNAVGRPAEALAEYERGKSLAGDHRRADLIAIMGLMARPDADPVVVKARLRDVGRRAALPMTLYKELADSLDDKEAARVVIRRAFDNPAYQDPVRIQTVLWFADRLGDKDLALAALRRTNLELGGIYTAFFLWDHYVTNLRTDPRFKEIVRELGLVDYWRASGNWGDFCKPVGTEDFECH